MLRRAYILTFILMVTLVGADALAWDFPAFRSRKVHLGGGGAPPSGPAVFSKARADFPHLLLVNIECLHKKPADYLKNLGFETQHKNSGDSAVRALNARYVGDFADLEKLLAKEDCIAGLTDNARVGSQGSGDPLYPNQPALKSIAQLEGERFFFHPIFGVRSPVTVAVVDSGTDFGHPDLIGRIWRAPDGGVGYDFVNGDADPSDDFGHGTHVAGLLLAQKDNGVGIRGVMGEWSRLMTVKSQDSFGGGTMADMINAFRWAVDQGAEVINLSLSSRQQNQALVDALDYAMAKKVTVVVAAGNDGEEITTGNFFTPVGYASAYSGVIGVGSVDADSGLRSNFSNVGAGFVEIGAPGSSGESTGILSTYPKGRYFGISGTSMAAPQVGGAAALATGFLKTHGMNFTPGQVEQLILNSATTNSANQIYFGGGRALNIESLGRYLFNSSVISSGGGFDD